MSFWLILFLTNLAFFVVPYLLNFKEEPNPVGFLFDKGNSIGFKLRSIFRKPTSDPFRVLFEYTLLILLGAIFQIGHPAFLVLCTVIGVLGWAMIVYNGVMLYGFSRSPVFRSDIQFAKTGLMIAYKQKYKIFLGILLLVLGSGFAIYKVSALLLSFRPDFWLLVLGIAATVFLGLFKIWNYKFRVYHYRTVYSFIGHMAKSIQYGNLFNFLFQLDETHFDQFNIYKSLAFTKKPNLVFISVESYGSIVYKDLPRFDDFNKKIKHFNTQLKDNNFHTATGMVLPPLFATGTWYSYCTFLFGMKIFDSTQYHFLFKNLKPFRIYQSIFDVFKSKGYTNFLLAPLGGGYKGLVDWELTRNIFSYDHIIDWEALDYQGQTIPFMKLGFMAPDQYSLYRGKELIRQESPGPYTMFYSTLNSHIPFCTPKSIAENWKDLNQPTHSYETTDSISVESNYEEAMAYQFDVLMDHILNDPDDNTIYVLYGDHQPTFITKEKFGPETPMHIISKNEDLLAPFLKAGFNDDLFPSTIEGHRLKLEGFFSLFMHSFNSVFGGDDLELPVMKEGIKLDN